MLSEKIRGEKPAMRYPPKCDYYFKSIPIKMKAGIVFIQWVNEVPIMMINGCNTSNERQTLYS